MVEAVDVSAEVEWVGVVQSLSWVGFCGCGRVHCLLLLKYIGDECFYFWRVGILSFSAGFLDMGFFGFGVNHIWGLNRYKNNTPML